MHSERLRSEIVDDGSSAIVARYTRPRRMDKQTWLTEFSRTCARTRARGADRVGQMVAPDA